MSSHISIRLTRDHVDFGLLAPEQDRMPRLFTPGDVVSDLQSAMKGHGTYVDGDEIKASVAGVVEKVNKLVSIKPLKSRYNGEIGDVVVGRIKEVQQKRWKVETNARLDSVLLLSSVNLPGGELRRRGQEDEQAMRKYLQEGDIVSAEVQNIFDDGSLSLYTRSLKYGKLGQGVLAKVFPALIKRRKTHFHNLPCGASLIMGNNGFIWISPITNQDVVDAAASTSGDGGYMQNLNEVVSRSEREVIARLRNCILALARCKIMLYDTSILYAYEESMKYEVYELLEEEAIFDVGLLTQHRLKEVDEY